MEALVVTTVHQADDPRIRERTIGSLAAGFRITYAARPPAPSRQDDITWVALTGGRVRRWWRALRLMASRRFAVVSIHDPELIPAGLLVRMLGRRVVVDIHEDVPSQVRHKGWLPHRLRAPLAWVAHGFLRLASRFLVVTLAEDGYRARFHRDHAVFPNFARSGALPPPAADHGYLVYVGDVTESRGAVLMVEAAALLTPRRPLVVVGRCRPDLAARLVDLARERDVELTLTGMLPHRQAMERAASAAAGLSLLVGVPNERDSMPTKVMEYLQLGIPVVASDLPGTRAVVAGLAGVVLVTPGDATAAAEGVVRAGEADRAALRVQADELRRTRVWPDDLVLAVYRDAAHPQGS